MNRIVAIHHIPLPKGGVLTPGEVADASCLTEEQMKRLLRLGAIRMDAPFSTPASDESENEEAPGQEKENRHDHANDDPVPNETSDTAEDEETFEEVDMPEIDAMAGIVEKPVQEAKKPAPKKPAGGRRNAK